MGFVSQSARGVVAKSIPSRSTREDIRKEARDLLNALRRRDPAALKRYHSFDPIAGMLEPRLDDAQYIIAREYGYSSWLKLRAHFQSP